jgi:thioredoxin-related protein
MRITTLIIIFFLLTTKAFPQLQPEPENLGLVKWMDLKTAQEECKKQPKPIMIDVYTDWCGWCKHMMKTTFSNPSLASYINSYYYPVRFNAESKDTIEFLGKKYVNKNVGNRSPNDLAVEMLEGKLSYPTTVFYNNNYKFKMLAPGYMKEKDIEPILVYTVEFIFNTTNAQDFQKYFYKAFYPDSGFVSKDTITWMRNIMVAADSNRHRKQKTLLFVSTDWCNGGKTMLKSTFNDSPVTDYIKQHFNTVFMNAQTLDTIVYNGKTYANTPENQRLHPFLHELVGQQMVLPTTLFFDEDMKFLTLVNQYLTPENLNAILHYFAEDIYKTQTWETYIKAYQEKK